MENFTYSAKMPRFSNVWHLPKAFTIFIGLCLVQLTSAQTVTLTTASASPWTVPANVTSINIRMWGAGGAGGASNVNSDAGSGAGSGGYTLLNNIGVTPGQNIPFTVGSGGVGAQVAVAAGGGASSILTLTANGGAGGIRNGAGAVGGTASGGSTNTTGATGGAGGGNTGGNGGNAPGGGGTGGAGQNNNNGNNGNTPGGGGGGSEYGLFTSRIGGNGGNGQIIITYTLPTITSFSPSGCVNPGATVNITGTNFTGATAVTFNGMAAAYTVNNATSITFTVPAGAVSGPVRVTAANGFVNSGTFNINPVAAAISGASNICPGATTSMTDATPGGVWGSSNTSVATINGSGVVNAGLTGSTIISYSVTISGCTTTVTKLLTVDPLPVLSGPTSGCLGASGLQLSPTTGGTWVSNNSSVATIDNLGNITTVSQGTATFTFTNSTTTCSATTATFNIVVPAAITIQPAVTQTLCDGGTASLTIAATGGALSYQWYKGASAVANSASISGATTPTLTFNPIGTADAGSNYHCVATNACGTADSNPAEIIVNLRPVIQAMTASACSTDPFDVLPVNGIPSSSTIVPAGTLYSWPAPVVTGGLTGGASGTNQSSIFGALTNPTNTAQTATYTVTPVSGTSGNCTGNPFTVVVTINPVPDIGNLTPSVCSGITYSTIPSNGGGNIVPTGTTFSWGLPAVTGGLTGATAQSGVTTITQMLNNPTNAVQTATYNITATSGSCTGSTFTVVITVNPKPTVAVDIASQGICSGTSIATITLSNPNSVPGATTYNWTRSNTANITGIPNGSGMTINGTLTNTTSVQQTTVFTVYAVSEEGCQSLAGTTSVTVDPLPVVSPIASQTVCSGNNITAITFSSNVAGTTFDWVRTNDISTPGLPATGSGSGISGALTNTTNTPQTTTFTVTPTAGSCTNPSGTATFSITVNPSTAAAATPLAQTVCGGGSLTITASDANGVAGTTYSFTKSSAVSGDNVTISGNVISGILQNNSGVDRIVTFTITASANGCPSTTAVTVTVQPNPVFTATPASQFVCNGNAFTTINFPAVAGVTYDWTRTNMLAAGNLTGLPDSMTNASSINGTFTNLTTTNQTTTFTITATTGNGCIRTSTASITVYPTLVAPVIEDSQTVCAGSRPTPLLMTVLPSGGSGSFTYQWQSAPAATGPWANITGATGSSYWPPTTTGTTPATFYHLIVNGCGTVTSNYVTVQVTNNANFTFSIGNGGTTVCPGAPFTPTITSAQFFPDSYIRFTWSADVNYITPSTGGPIGTTNTTYIFGFPLFSVSTATLPLSTINNTNANVTTTVYITPNIYDSSSNAFICSLSPTATTVTIRPRPTATITAPPAGTTICSGTSAGVTVTGNITTETMSYIFTRSVSANVTSSATFPVNTPAVAIGGSYTLNDNLTNLSASTQNVTYTITPKSASGCSGTPITFTITVAPQVIPGTIGTNHSVCTGGDPSLLTEVTAASGSGTLTYQWLSGPSATGPWTAISGATATTYDPPSGLAVTTYYIRQVSSIVNGVTCSVANTTPVQVRVNTVNAGAVAANQTICSGSDPAAFTVTTAATGAGTLSYIWESSTTGCSGPWTTVATTSTYDPPVLTQTTYYRRTVNSTISAQICTAYNTCLVITINQVTPGSVGADEILCGNNPAAFTQITPATGSGTLSYQWESSTTGCGSGFSTISGATSSTYDPPSGLTQTTYYHRIVYATVGASVCSAVSNCITVTANSVTGGTISGNRTVCTGGDPAAFTQTVPASGIALTYQWQFSTTGAAGPWSNIVGATGVTYDAPGAITQVTYFQRVATATVGATTCSATSNFVTVFVNDVTPSTISGSQTVCNTTDPTAFTVSTAATGNGAITYQWQSSIAGCGGPWANIAGATSAVYDPPMLAQTTYYHVIVNSTLNAVVCSATSNCVSVTSLTKTWNGSISTDWATAANWTPNGVPNASNCVIIPNVTNKPYVLGALYDAYAYSVTVMNGATLEVIPTNSITVTDIVTVNPGGNIYIKNNASLIQINNVANTGIVTIERTTQPMYRYDYTYWNSPLTAASGFTLGALSPNTQPDKYYHWNPTNSGGNGGWIQEGIGTLMLPTLGYIVRAPNSFSTNPAVTQAYTVNFVGTPNNGDISVPIAIGTLPAATYFDKMNLIGNPYPSAVDANLFLNDGVNTPLLDGTLYFWTHHSPPSAAYANPFYGTFTNNYSAGDYATYNKVGGVATVPTGYGGPVPNGYIASGQSFFVKGLANGNAIFRNSMRSKSNSAFFRITEETERHRIWLNLGNAGAGFSQTLVGYAEGATNALDRGYDGEAFSGNFVSLYSVAGERNLTIQGRALPFDESDTVDIGYRATAAGTCTLGIDHLDGIFETQAIFLQDNLLNVIYDIRQTPYVFASEAGTFNTRFVLRFTNPMLGTSQYEASHGLVAFITNGKLMAQASQKIDVIEVYDLTGKLVKTFSPGNEKIFGGEFPYSNGIYLAKFRLSDDTISELKLINGN